MATIGLDARLRALTRQLSEQASSNDRLAAVLAKLEKALAKQGSPGRKQAKELEEGPNHSGQIPEGPLPDEDTEPEDGREARKLPRPSVAHKPSPNTGQKKLARSRVESPAYVQRPGKMRP